MKRENGRGWFGNARLSAVAVVIMWVAVEGVHAATNYTWNSTSGGNWSDTSATGWNTNSYPNGVDDSAIFVKNITVAQTITLDVANGVTVGSLIFQDTGSTFYPWTLTNTAGQAVTLSNSGGSAFVSVRTVGSSSGSYAYNRVETPFRLESALTISNASIGKVATYFAGAITETNGVRTLTKEGVEDYVAYIGAGTFLGGGSADTIPNAISGLTTINAGRLVLDKADNVLVVGGDILINGGLLEYTGAQPWPVTANITLNGGSFAVPVAKIATVNNFVVSNGTVSTSTAGNGWRINALTTTVVNGKFQLTTRSNWQTKYLNISGGTNILTRTAGSGSTLTVSNMFTISQPASGAFTALLITNPVNASLGGLVLAGGDLIFNGSVGNPESVKIEAATSGADILRSTAQMCVIQLEGDRTFTINNNGGGAAVDLVLEPSLINGASSGGLIKAGNGTLLSRPISGTNTYTGATTINAGKLIMDGLLTTGSGTVTVNDGGTLGGTGTIWRAITVASNATLAAGNSSTPAMLTTTNLTLSEGAIIECDVAGGGMDRVAVNGTLTLGTNVVVKLSQSGSLPSPATLLSATTLAGAQGSPALSGWRVVPDVAWVEVSGNTVVLHPRSGTMLVIE